MFGMKGYLQVWQLSAYFSAIQPGDSMHQGQGVYYSSSKSIIFVLSFV